MDFFFLLFVLSTFLSLQFLTSSLHPKDFNLSICLLKHTSIPAFCSILVHWRLSHHNPIVFNNGTCFPTSPGWLGNLTDFFAWIGITCTVLTLARRRPGLVRCDHESKTLFFSEFRLVHCFYFLVQCRLVLKLHTLFVYVVGVSR